MLQQTRVETVTSYFHRWMSRFPTVESLASSSEQEVLKEWEGLGYYARARNLHKAAKIVQKNHHGRLLGDLTGLRKLPGIGQYTAAAIASLSFGQDVPALDGNVRRVLSRLFDVSVRVDTPKGESILHVLAQSHLPKGRAGDFNQALMDLGSMICLPKHPHCLECPLMNSCKAYELGNQEKRPVRKLKSKIPHFVQFVAVISRRGRVLLTKRPSTGLLGGLWEFPNARVTGDPSKYYAVSLKKLYDLRIRRRSQLGVIRHAYSHFSITAHAYSCKLIDKPIKSNLSWVRTALLDDYPMGKVDRQIARLLR